MKQNKTAAFLTAAALLLTAGTFPTQPAVFAAETESGDVQQEVLTYGALSYVINTAGITVTACDPTVTEVTIPAEIDGIPVKKVEADAFAGCKALTDVVYHAAGKVEVLFAETNLKTLTIGGKVTSISKNILDGCDYVHLILRTKSIPFGTLGQCSAITELTLGDEVETMGTSSFCNCPFIMKVNIGKGLQVFDSSSLLGCGSIGEFSVSEENPYYASVDGALYDRELTTMYRYPAGKVADSFAVPDTVEFVFRNTFHTSTLREITLHAGVNMVGANAFCDAAVLENIHVAEENECYHDTDGVLYDTRYASLHTYPLGKPETSFTVPEGTKEIGMNAFLNHTELNEISLPDSVTVLSDGAFQNCTGLQKIDLPKKMEHLGASAFNNCAVLEAIEFPEGPERVSDSLFMYCHSLKEITLPETVRYIDINGFHSCTSLTQVNLPSSLESIEYYAFNYCESLKNIVFPEGLQLIRNSFQECTALETVHFPKSLKTIESYAFTIVDPITDIYYAGTPAQWCFVDIGFGNDAFTGATVHYEETGTSAQMKTAGDVSSDVMTGTDDLIYLHKYLNGHRRLTKQELAAADMSGDGIVDGFDLALLKRKLLKK